MQSIRHLLPALFLITAVSVQAQRPFVEGAITYSVSLGPVSGGAGFTEHAGTYTVTVKENQVRKELSMNSGYHYTLIMNTSTGAVHALQSNAGQNYAIQLSMDDLLEKQKPYRNFSRRDDSGHMTVAGLPCRKAIITYKDGTRSELYYTTDWQTNNATLFDRFPGLEYLPLAFEYRNEEGITMHFQAEKVAAVPVEASLFRIPPEYRIISNAEYKQQRR